MSKEKTVLTIDVQYAHTAPQWPTPEQFQTWAENAIKDIDACPANGELCIRLVDTDESQSLNHSYRSKDKPTNVLSFPGDLTDYGLPPEVAIPLGDLVICSDVVKQEAQAQNKVLEHHWAHMVTHGILHLLGYDHETDEEATQMERLEVLKLAQINIPDPYQVDDTLSPPTSSQES